MEDKECSFGMNQTIEIHEKNNSQLEKFSYSVGACYMCSAFNQCILSDRFREFIQHEIKKYLNQMSSDSLLIQHLEQSGVKDIPKHIQELQNHFNSRPIRSMKEEFHTLNNYYKERFSINRLLKSFSLSCSKESSCSLDTHESFTRKYIYKFLFLRICQRYFPREHLTKNEETNIFLIIVTLFNENDTLINDKGGSQLILIYKLLFILFDDITPQAKKQFDKALFNKLIQNHFTKIAFYVGYVAATKYKNENRTSNELKELLKQKDFIIDVYDYYWKQRTKAPTELMKHQTRLLETIYPFVYDISVNDLMMDVLEVLDKSTIQCIIDTANQLKNVSIDEAYHHQLMNTIDLETMISRFGLTISKEIFESYVLTYLKRMNSDEHPESLINKIHLEKIQEKQTEIFQTIQTTIQKYRPHMVVICVNTQLAFHSVGSTIKHSTRLRHTQSGGTKPLTDDVINMHVLNKYQSELIKRLKSYKWLKDYIMDSAGISYSPKKVKEHFLGGKMLGVGHAVAGITCKGQPILVDSNLPEKPFEKVMWKEGSIYKYNVYDPTNGVYKRSSDRLLKLHDQPIYMEPGDGNEVLEHMIQGYKKFKVTFDGDMSKQTLTSSLDIRYLNFIVFHRKPEIMGGKRKHKRK